MVSSPLLFFCYFSRPCGFDDDMADFLFPLLCSLFLSHSSRSLRPGGTIEHVEFDWELRARDNTMPENSALQRWNSQLQAAMFLAGYPLNMATIDACLRASGFVDICHHTIDAGCNPWSPIPAESNVARWLNLALVCSVEGMTLVPFTRYLRKTYEEAIEMVKEFQREVCTLRIRSYGTVCVVFLLPWSFFICSIVFFIRSFYFYARPCLSVLADL